MKSSILPEQNCPHCGHHMDATVDTHEDPRSPQVGDMSLCFYCGDLSWFGTNLMLVSMTADEAKTAMSELPQNTVNLINACKRKYLQSKLHLN